MSLSDIIDDDTPMFIGFIPRDETPKLVQIDVNDDESAESIEAATTQALTVLDHLAMPCAVCRRPHRPIAKRLRSADAYDLPWLWWNGHRLVATCRQKCSLAYMQGKQEGKVFPLGVPGWKLESGKFGWTAGPAI